MKELEKKDIEVQEEIAIGKTGKVFKGRWGSQDKTIAVKILISEEFVIREVRVHVHKMFKLQFCCLYYYRQF